MKFLRDEFQRNHMWDINFSSFFIRSVVYQFQPQSVWKGGYFNLITIKRFLTWFRGSHSSFDVSFCGIFMGTDLYVMKSLLSPLSHRPVNFQNWLCGFVQCLLDIVQSRKDNLCTIKLINLLSNSKYGRHNYICCSKRAFRNCAHWISRQTALNKKCPAPPWPWLFHDAHFFLWKKCYMKCGV